MDCKGKIYAIKSNQTELFYIGSTIEPLLTRFNCHKQSYKGYKDGKYHFVSSFDILQYEDAYIELIEDFECQNRLGLTKREGELIKQHNCVNKKIEGRTKREYYQDNTEQFKEKHKAYREQHKEQKNEYQKNIEKIIKKKIKEYGKQKTTCECGSVFRIDCKARHLRTNKHLEFIKLVNIN